MTNQRQAQKMQGLAPSVVHRVVEHMNDDHADAVLLYAKTFGGVADATAARMTSIDLSAMDLDYSSPTGSGRIRVSFDPPLAEASEIRPRLVAMVGDARERQPSDPPG